MNTPFFISWRYQRGKPKESVGSVNFKILCYWYRPWRSGIDCRIKCHEWF